MPHPNIWFWGLKGAFPFSTLDDETINPHGESWRSSEFLSRWWSKVYMNAVAFVWPTWIRPGRCLCIIVETGRGWVIREDDIVLIGYMRSQYCMWCGCGEERMLWLGNMAVWFTRSVHVSVGGLRLQPMCRLSSMSSKGSGRPSEGKETASCGAALALKGTP